MKNRFVIAVIAFALAFLPCAKFAYAWVGPELPSSSGHLAADSVDDAEFGLSDDSSDRLCVKCCSKSKAVVTSVEPLTVPQVTKHLAVADWFDQPDLPTGSAALILLGARGTPPLMAATSYKAMFAKTSRFQT